MNKTFSNLFTKQILDDKLYARTVSSFFKKYGKLSQGMVFRNHNFISFANLHKNLQVFNFEGKLFFTVEGKPINHVVLSTVNANRMQDNFYYTHNALRASHIIGDDFKSD